MRLRASRSHELAAAAAAGSRPAWQELVDAYGELVWTVVQQHQLDPADAVSVAGLTWLRCAERLGETELVDEIGALLAATAREEARHRRVTTGREPIPASRSHSCAGPVLSTRCEHLLELLRLDPVPSYGEISAALGVPLASIGPSRLRCLVRLQQILRQDGTH